MRALILILMIALLPLRGWAGEVMATEMASTELSHVRTQAEYSAEVTTELGAGHARIDWLKASFDDKKEPFLAQNQPLSVKTSGPTAMHDCDGHPQTGATLPADADTDATAHAESHCSTCPACQACHTVALSASAVSLGAILLPRALPHPAADHFASATAALGQKPPIS